MNDKQFLDLISAIYCNVRTRTKVDVTYLFRWHFHGENEYVNVLPKRIICDSECQYRQRRGDWQLSSICSSALCSVKLV